MQFPDDTLIRIIIFVLGLCGFWVARRIHKHKKANKILVCPVGFDCHAVIHSNYSEFMHVPLEIFGMIYYAFLSIFYLFSIFISDIIPVVFSSFLVLITFGAFLFSIYLLGVQIFILKKGCSWCIVSAVICLCIFLFSIFGV
ncbi:hypothetical protein A2W67_01310 [Candidatus Nomurabacteria bacterium RIFCSPLOWO2_02_40_28]|uniref:Vitamin K epoxide reductase n=1 Tax=Candidatus Nomurabacteria bacterium GW2011_GWC2_39_41 TaxID=1618754 RepID=A0A837HRK7_9BACT|nr:MAG: Vitamin K epoxide reductase [Candidatus Nomurabacteria bacterium GW2011_GWC2_39_41]KKR37421.1 MAG: Vitamin K epoxide reductase [Candidatus Nomurabacteria bacterium GW2011_GWE2_40_10]KKR38669.1 MAG: Vitamin K epoxide reductase [Candidatus Nomurabacteria bacterium GW2011_GWB1_40_11]KKR40394.1 MAG: Vitamin K epoxide reductase [Parcubacteria group bacterium GW2011_GWC1_40_11]KKR59497.1 MAG: Vitamin K epoxide reductase [Candidatus Nomurabacteria bacterium GW2011_GWF2_40_31]KKR66660.1 MAG: V